MLKKVLELIKKIIFAVLFIYGYNLMASSMNLAIPINLYTVGVVSLLGIPAMLCLVLVMMFAF